MSPCYWIIKIWHFTEIADYGPAVYFFPSQPSTSKALHSWLSVPSAYSDWTSPTSFLWWHCRWVYVSRLTGKILLMWGYPKHVRCTVQVQNGCVICSLRPQPLGQGKFIRVPSTFLLSNCTVYRGFWTAFIVLAVAISLVGGFLLVCGVPFVHAKFYKVGGGFLLVAGKLSILNNWVPGMQRSSLWIVHASLGERGRKWMNTCKKREETLKTNKMIDGLVGIQTERYMLNDMEGRKGQTDDISIRMVWRIDR